MGTNKLRFRWLKNKCTSPYNLMSGDQSRSMLNYNTLKEFETCSNFIFSHKKKHRNSTLPNPMTTRVTMTPPRRHRSWAVPWTSQPPPRSRRSSPMCPKWPSMTRRKRNPETRRRIRTKLLDHNLSNGEVSLFGTCQIRINDVICNKLRWQKVKLRSILSNPIHKNENLENS